MNIRRRHLKYPLILLILLSSSLYPTGKNIVYDIIVTTEIDRQFQKICDQEVDGIDIVFKTNSTQSISDGGIKFALEYKNISNNLMDIRNPFDVSPIIMFDKDRRQGLPRYIPRFLPQIKTKEIPNLQLPFEIKSVMIGDKLLTKNEINNEYFKLRPGESLLGEFEITEVIDLTSINKVPYDIPTGEYSILPRVYIALNNNSKKICSKYVVESVSIILK